MTGYVNAANHQVDANKLKGGTWTPSLENGAVYEIPPPPSKVVEALRRIGGRRSWIGWSGRGVRTDGLRRALPIPWVYRRGTPCRGGAREMRQVGRWLRPGLRDRPHGFVSDQRAVAKARGREIKLWGSSTTATCIWGWRVKQVLKPGGAGRRPSADTWRFNLKAGADDAVGRSFPCAGSQRRGSGGPARGAWWRTQGPSGPPSYSCGAGLHLRSADTDQRPDGHLSGSSHRKTRLAPLAGE